MHLGFKVKRDQINDIVLLQIKTIARSGQSEIYDFSNYARDVVIKVLQKEYGKTDTQHLVLKISRNNQGTLMVFL